MEVVVGGDDTAVDIFTKYRRRERQVELFLLSEEVVEHDSRVVMQLKDILLDERKIRV